MKTLELGKVSEKCKGKPIDTSTALCKENSSKISRFRGEGDLEDVWRTNTLTMDQNIC